MSNFLADLLFFVFLSDFLSSRLFFKDNLTHCIYSFCTGC
ncbi:hypothetical protein CSC18_1355 [Klebsiella aerogenes]|nr:hypothetical protein CSC18_1355 [Klebsiella aerogenes]